MGLFAGRVDGEIIDHPARVPDRAMNPIRSHATGLNDSIMEDIFRLGVRMQYSVSDFYKFWFVLNKRIDKNIAIIRVLFFFHFCKSLPSDYSEEVIAS